jgi:hypothetical protein
MAIEPPANEGVANEPLAIEGVANKLLPACKVMKIEHVPEKAS